MSFADRSDDAETAAPTVPLDFLRHPPEEVVRRAAAFAAESGRRRSVRMFSDEPVKREAVLECIRAAGTAPSGANLQPWHFVLVGDPDVKRQIRSAAEKEERAFYEERAPASWLEALRPLGTDAEKPFLEVAPWLVVLFARTYGLGPAGERQKHYYVSESVGIAAGLFIAAIHQSGLATLTHTPSPMGFLGDILGRPVNERAFLLLPVGVPADRARVPDIRRKPLSDIVSFV